MAQASENVAVSKAVNATARTDNAGRNDKKVIIRPAERIIVSVEEFKKRFKFYNNNRGTGTDVKRAEEIAKSIAFKGTGWLLEDVVADSKTGIVYDKNTSGLARVIAHDKYGVDIQIAVQLVDLPEGTEVWKATSDFNTKRKPWVLSNFVWNHINEGHESYIRLKELCDELGGLFIKNGTTYEWSYVSSLSGKPQKDAMRSGRFEFRKRDYAKRLAFGREVNAIWEKAGKPNQGAWAEPFIIALRRVKDIQQGNYSLDRILKNLRPEDFDASQSLSTWQTRICRWLSY